MGDGALDLDTEQLSPEVLHVLRRIAEPYLQSLCCDNYINWCRRRHRHLDDRYFVCSRTKGHTGFHVACYQNGELCDIDPWYDNNHESKI